jgi:multiple sugar transport system permease protein
LIIANATVTLPFATIILRPFLSRVPLELEEAAQLDGAGRVKSMTSVVLPLIRPGLITVASLSFIIAWGDLIFGLTLTTDLAYRPATVALTEFVTQFATRWDLLMAGAAATAAPIVLIYILLQRYIVPGLTEGSLD